MKNLTVKAASRSIEVSKSFNTLASRYGTDEYKALQEVRRDYPGYEVVVVATRKAPKSSYKGLTYDYSKSVVKWEISVSKHSEIRMFFNPNSPVAVAYEQDFDFLHIDLLWILLHPQYHVFPPMASKIPCRSILCMGLNYSCMGAGPAFARSMAL